MTHSDLVCIGAKWLQRKCSVVMTELNTSGECADVIGWQGTRSTLIECKVSRADFHSDQGKSFRRYDEMGMGQHRYYMALAGVIPIGMVPDKWGLLELTSCGICITKKSELFEDINSRHEIGLLLSALRRIGQNAPEGISIKCYTFKTQNTATLGIIETDTLKDEMGSHQRTQVAPCL